ncbi:MAG: hypothetical protein EHM20_06205 [Alphaproteobacteria bacterium]|nr:MAG: hypothetical protein EHM20_06205 [Alphaproteobacteria bacterium]
MALRFYGKVKNVQYRAFLTKELPQYGVDDFDINKARACGKITFKNGEIAYSKWVSPKRTRTYPFERIYNTLNSKTRLTVIPVLKDEGLNGDLDRIQYSTISWMNLLNIYIVLAYYDKANKSVRPLQVAKDKISNQKFNNEIVNSQILRIIGDQLQSALHWNITLIEEQFINIYRLALDSYENISKNEGVKVHGRVTQEQYLAIIMRDFHMFRDISLRGSRGASIRETMTTHALEYLGDGAKASFEIENYLGGIYYLTADEVIEEKRGNSYVIQESKNCSEGFLPGLSDIKDGLFKLIIYSNLDTLILDSVPVNFKSRLKLTGRKVKGTLLMPCDEVTLAEFLEINKGNCSKREADIIRKLNLESANNNRLEILVSPNS